MFLSSLVLRNTIRVELGGTQILEKVQYFIKYHSINKYHGILVNAFMYPVKYSNNFS